MIALTQSARLTAEEALLHPWLDVGRGVDEPQTASFVAAATAAIDGSFGLFERAAATGKIREVQQQEDEEAKEALLGAFDVVSVRA